jgi:uncharacterized protein involved in response to NO
LSRFADPQRARALADALFREPYRPFFLLGAVYAFVSVALWFVWSDAFWRGAPLPVAWVLPPQRAHALALLWGVFTPYVVGFLLTAFVRWVEAEPPPRRLVGAWAAVIAVCPILCVYGSLRSSVAVRVGLFAEAFALVTVLAFLTRALLVGRTQTRVQPAVVLVALSAGVIALGLGGVGAAALDSQDYRVSILVGLYAFLFLLVASVGRRLFPFFTASFLGASPPRPAPGLLLLFVGLLGLRLILEVRPPHAPQLGGAPWVDLGLLCLLAAEFRRFRSSREAWRNPMLVVLYVGWTWLLVAFGLSAAHGFLGYASPLLELPVLHALTIGGLGTLVLGVSTRVSLGHAGRPIVADGWIRLAFVLIQLAALTRVGLLLISFLLPAARPFAHWGGVPWCLAFGIWLVRVGPLLVRRSEPTSMELPIRPP